MTPRVFQQGERDMNDPILYFRTEFFDRGEGI